MSGSLEVLASLSAGAITLGTICVVAVLAEVLRRRGYRSFEDKSREILAWQFPISSLEASPAEDRRKALAPLVEATHKKTNAAQTRYHAAVAGSAGCLVAAFLAISLHTLSPPSRVEQILIWLDPVAISSVVLLFLLALSAGRQWILLRAGTEFLRQFQYLQMVLPSASSPLPANEIEARYDLELKVVKSEVETGRFRELLPRIERFWIRRRTLIERSVRTEEELTSDALLAYLDRRVRRQLGWFADSQARLEHVAIVRKKVLFGLYGLALFVAFLRLGLHLKGIDELAAYLAPIALLITGMSAVMTVYYINQNTRSLIHRYNSQQRWIVQWIEAFNERWNLADLTSTEIDASGKNEMLGRILQFEDLMVEELIDWVHITTHDAVELAP